MKIVMFPMLDNNYPDIDSEIEVHLDFFPIIGDSIIHDDIHYQVVGRYVISHSREDNFRAARVQYTLEVKVIEGN